ncbi:MAG: hypothetical protein KDK66_09170, partial [Deltaproteobacteria bacterium]|nr:hypothetical protein [Deltaproteobacteria bacterium]
MKAWYLKILILLPLLIVNAACGGNDRRDFLKLPSLVAVDASQARVFVVDSRNNGLNLLDASTGEIQGFGDKGQEALLNEESTLLLPA